MTGMSPQNVLAFLRHCLACEVEWPGADGEQCWSCGKPGEHGSLPALTVPAKSKATP